MHQNEWLAVRFMIERHQSLLAEAEGARALKSRRPAQRRQVRRHLASALASLADRLDPERAGHARSNLAR